MIELQVQGQTLSVDGGIGNLLALLRSEGFEVPSLCYHKALTPYGSCRLCLVEVARPGRAGRVVAACTHPVLAGLVVTLDSPKVVAARRLVLELLLAHSPDAPLIQDLARRYGVDASRFEPVEKPGNCILCGLCEQVCRDVVGASAITLSGRGIGRLVERPFHDDSACIGCGLCDVVCPTGVLTMQNDGTSRFRSLPGEARPCRYALMGLIPHALCANDYRCDCCETEHRMVSASHGEPPLLAAAQMGKEGP